MAICSILSVGYSLPEVISETEEVLIRKFDLEPAYEGSIPPDPTASREGQLLAERQLQNVLLEKPNEALFALAVTPYDLYSRGLNFVFGVAFPFKGAIVSYARLLSENRDLFFSRVRKEVTHEMGHVFGLPHCPNPHCVMHFSNSLADTDRKGEDFCPACKKKLDAVKRRLKIL